MLYDTLNIFIQSSRQAESYQTAIILVNINAIKEIKSIVILKNFALVHAHDKYFSVKIATESSQIPLKSRNMRDYETTKNAQFTSVMEWIAQLSRTQESRILAPLKRIENLCVFHSFVIPSIFI